MESTVPSILAGLGIAHAVGMSAFGSVIATTAAAPYLVNSRQDEMLIFAFAPIVISGVLSIYGMIVGIIASQVMNDAANKESSSLTILDGGRIFAAGLTVGLSCLASGQGLADFLTYFWYNSDGGQTSGCSQLVDQKEEMPLIDVDNNNNNNNSNKKLYATKRRLLIGVAPNMSFRFVMSLFMLEAIGLYGLIVALFVLGSDGQYQVSKLQKETD